MSAFDDKPGARILLIRLKAMGDILLTLPAVHAVRDSHPGARITYLVSREHASLLEGFRDVNDVIALDRRVYRQWNFVRTLGLISSLLRRLRAERFTMVVDFQGYGETAFLTRWTAAPQRWGTVHRRARAWAYTRHADHDMRVHPADWHLMMLRRCGLEAQRVRNEYCLPAAAQSEAREYFSAQGFTPGRPTLYLQPFTSNPQKNWPLARYIELGRYWQSRNVQVIIGGAPGDLPQLAEARSLGFVVPAGLSRLADAGLMSLSTLVVGGDTGFLHWAVSMGKRVLMLMIGPGPGSATPVGHPEWVLSAPIRSSLDSMPVEQVIQAMRRILEPEQSFAHG